MGSTLAPDLIVGYHRGYRASWETCLGDLVDADAEDMERGGAVVRIEMIVFSGSRNPNWRLDSEDIWAFQAALRKLSRASRPLEIPERLGYCGMVVLNEDQTQPWTDAVVYHQLVVVHHRNRTDYLIDDDRILENILLETARDHVKEEVIESIRAEPQAMGSG